MRFLLVSIIMVLFATTILPQGQMRKKMDPNRKINQLEKVKLMETLNLEDETAVKFFNLKDQHQRNMTELREKSDKILDILQETLSGGESTNNSSLNKLIEDFKKSEAELNLERRRYLKEAGALMPVEEFAKLLVFERNFRTEVRELIMGQRNKRMERAGNN
jgi:hypothetical protein